MAQIELRTDVAGKVWQIDAEPGSRLTADEPVVTLESMKMEVPIVMPVSGTVVALRVAQGDAVAEDDVVAVIEAD